MSTGKNIKKNFRTSINNINKKLREKKLRGIFSLGKKIVMSSKQNPR